MPQPLKICKRQISSVVANSIMSHIGCIMAPGNVRIPAQIFKNMRAPLLPVTYDLTSSLHPGTQNHNLFKLVRQIRIIGNRLKKLKIINVRANSTIVFQVL